MKSGWFLELSSDDEGKVWHVRIRSGTGRILFSSEIYDNKANAKRAMARAAAVLRLPTRPRPSLKG